MLIGTPAAVGHLPNQVLRNPIALDRQRVVCVRHVALFDALHDGVNLTSAGRKRLSWSGELCENVVAHAPPHQVQSIDIWRDLAQRPETRQKFGEWVGLFDPMPHIAHHGDDLVGQIGAAGGAQRAGQPPGGSGLARFDQYPVQVGGVGQRAQRYEGVLLRRPEERGRHARQCVGQAVRPQILDAIDMLDRQRLARLVDEDRIAERQLHAAVVARRRVDDDLLGSDVAARVQLDGIVRVDAPVVSEAMLRIAAYEFARMRHPGRRITILRARP